MTLNFIVTPAAKYFFAIDVHSVTCTIDRPDPNYARDYTFRMNFDNYRHVKSPVSAKRPQWDDAVKKIVFIYETNFPHLLIGKLCRVSLWSGDQFLGDASIDLLTLATGPSRIALTLFSGDCAIGHMYLVMRVEEVCQTTVSTSGLKVSEFRGALANVFTETLSLVVKKRASDDAVEAPAPATFSTTDATFDVPEHQFAMDSTSLMDVVGYLFLLHGDGAPIAHATILFKEWLVGVCPNNAAAEPATDEASTTFSRAEFLHEDSSDLRVLPPVVDSAGRHTTARRFDFRAPLLAVGSGAEVGTIEGTISMSRTITFVQMKDGVTVDGVVSGTPVHGFVRPPFLASDAMNQADSSTPAAGATSDRRVTGGGEDEHAFV